MYHTEREMRSPDLGLECELTGGVGFRKGAPGSMYEGEEKREIGKERTIEAAEATIADRRLVLEPRARGAGADGGTGPKDGGARTDR
jgi:hypothetical protein